MMTGKRPTHSDVSTRIENAPMEGDASVQDGTLVVAHGDDVKSASSLKVDYAAAAHGSHLSLIGKYVGPYKIQAELGVGGMGAVYLAEQFEPVRRQVALKVIKAGMDSEEVLSRFQSERELLARMNHPNIAQVLDVGATSEGRLFFAMEFVPGTPLNEFCDRRGMDIAHRLDLFLQVCEGVHHAHQKGVIHRDLKPSNLMVADYQGKLLVKVIDFGIAKSMDTHGRGDTGSTRMGVPIGTPAYMSPEQAAGDLAAIDTRTDVYSLGVVLYRLITRDLPISSDTIAKAIDTDLARVLREANIRPPSRKVLEIAGADELGQTEWKRAMSGDAQALSRTLKGDLDWITLKALARERDFRYASVSEFAADVRRYLAGEAVLAGPPSKLYLARKFVGRNKLAVGAAAAVVLTLILGIIGTSYMAIEAQRQRARAEAALKEAQEQRDRAEAESARAVATRGFLEEMIAAPDPWKLQGGSPETRNVRVVDALKTAASSLEKSLADNSALRGEIATMLGRTLRRLGQIDSARLQLESAVKDLRAAFPETAAQRVRGEIELAITESESGNHDKAWKTFEHLLPMLDRIEGLPADAIDEARRAAATALSVLGEGAKAEELARDNLKRAITQGGEFCTSASGAKAALAEVLGERGAWEEADKLLNEAYNTERQRLGNEHPIVLQLLSNAANLSFRSGDFELAEQRYREVASTAEKVLGPEHPETLRYRAHVAVAMANAGRNEEAIRLFEPLIAKRKALLGADHVDVLMMQANYGVALRANGQIDTAEKVLDEVYQRRRKVLGDTHPETLRVLGILGVIARDRKDLARAEVLLRQAADLYEKANGPNHPESLIIRNNYLSVVRDRGKFQIAADGYRNLLPLAEGVFPEGHVMLATMRGNYGQALLELKDYAAAEPLLLASFRDIRRSHPQVGVPRARLERLYRETGRTGQLAEVLK